MRRRHRLIALGLVFVLTSIIGGCGSVPSWDPTDMLDFLDTKKKTPGDRKPVFPEGVPGLSQGVPKDLIKGSPENQAAENADVAVGQPVEAAPPAPPAAAPRRAAAKSHRRAAPAAAPEVAPDDSNVGEEAPAAAPPPKKRAAVRHPTAKRPPAQAPAAASQDAAPAAQQSDAPAFPAPLPSGTFSR